MLIFRYLARDFIASASAVTVVLLMIVMSGRFVKYLAEAAAGDMDAGILFSLIGARLPGFLELIIPLACFLGVLLAYGRLYVQHEMTVMIACGISQIRLAAYTLAPALIMALLVSYLSLYATPNGTRKAETLISDQNKRGDLDGMAASHFYPLQKGKGVTYAEEINEDGLMLDVFLAEHHPDAEDGKQMVLTVSKTGEQKSADDGIDYLVLRDGYRIQGMPGQADYQITRFEEFGQSMQKQNPDRRARKKTQTLSTSELMKSDNLDHIAALQWRFSVPILVLVMSLIAVPLSKTNQREGRFSKMIPAVLLYMIYLVLLNSARGFLEEGLLSPYIGLWSVHFLFFLIALLLLFFPSIKLRFKEHIASSVKK